MCIVCGILVMTSLLWRVKALLVILLLCVCIGSSNIINEKWRRKQWKTIDSSSNNDNPM